MLRACENSVLSQHSTDAVDHVVVVFPPVVTGQRKADDGPCLVLAFQDEVVLFYKYFLMIDPFPDKNMPGCRGVIG